LMLRWTLCLVEACHLQKNLIFDYPN
jgi:hypothetical protein